MSAPKKNSKGSVVSTTVSMTIPNGKGKKASPLKRVKRKTGQQKLTIPGGINMNTDQRRVFQDYINTLNDPFEHGPVRLGFGCCVNTVLATAYLRGTFTAGVSKNAAFQMYPCVGFGVPYTWSCSTSADGSAFSAIETDLVPANQTFLNDNFREMRVVSGGIRVKPLAPLTGTEPLIYGGVANGGPMTDVRSATIASLKTSLNTDVILGNTRSGVQVVIRPIDIGSYEFQSGIVVATSGSLVTHPYIVVSTDNTTSVHYEMILHLEGLPRTNAGIGSPATNEVNWLSSLAGVFNNIEQLIGAVTPYLGSAVKGAEILNSVAEQVHQSKFAQGYRLGDYITL